MRAQRQPICTQSIQKCYDRLVAITEEAAERLRRAGELLEVALVERADAILAAQADGATLREIGLALGMSHGGVRKILQRNGD